MQTTTLQGNCRICGELFYTKYQSDKRVYGLTRSQIHYMCHYFGIIKHHKKPSDRSLCKGSSFQN